MKKTRTCSYHTSSYEEDADFPGIVRARESDPGTFMSHLLGPGDAGRAFGGRAVEQLIEPVEIGQRDLDAGCRELLRRHGHRPQVTAWIAARVRVRWMTASALKRCSRRQASTA